MKGNPQISVVVPVYKVEHFLQECIDSILAQTYRDFELILVDDGSPDSCGDICDRNALKDHRIRVIHQTNQGVTRARANGVAAACGEFVTFVDGDDTIPVDALENLISPVNDDIDIVLGKHHRSLCPPKGLINADKYREFCATLSCVSPSPCAKLFRRCLLEEDVFNTPSEVKNGEDSIMNVLIGYRLQKKAYSINTVVYNYRNNLDSATHLHRTPEMMALYQKYRLAAIPKGDVEKFLPLGLADSLIEYWNSAASHRIFIPKSAHEAMLYLKEIQKYTSYRWGVLQSLHFRTFNPFARAAIILARRMIAFIRKLKQKIEKIES